MQPDHSHSTHEQESVWLEERLLVSLSLCLQTFQVLLLLHLPIIPIRGCRLLGWGPNILLGVEANIRILQPPHLVSMAIPHMCASATIQCRRIPA